VIARTARHNATIGVGMRLDPFNLAATREKLLDGFFAVFFSLRR
jgi:hypothetical protein